MVRVKVLKFKLRQLLIFFIAGIDFIRHDDFKFKKLPVSVLYKYILATEYRQRLFGCVMFIVNERCAVYGRICVLHREYGEFDGLITPYVEGCYVTVDIHITDTVKP